MRVKVSENLRPFDLPHTAEILEARCYGDARAGWTPAVPTAQSPRYPGGGTEPPVSSAVTGAAGSSPAGPSSSSLRAAPSMGSSLGNRIVSFDPVEHRDITDAAFDQLDHVPSKRGGFRRGWRVSSPVTPRSFAVSVTAKHLASTLGEPVPSQSRGDTWIRVMGCRIRSFRNGRWLSRGKRVLLTHTSNRSGGDPLVITSWITNHNHDLETFLGLGNPRAGPQLRA